MKIKMISAFCLGMLMVSCSSEEAVNVENEMDVIEVSSELTEQLEAEQALNEQAHQLNDELDQFMNDLEQ